MGGRKMPKKKRINLVLSFEDYQALERAQRVFNASSITSGVRRSVQLALKLVEFQEGNGQILYRGADGVEHRLLIL
jgi:hypothetical protein